MLQINLSYYQNILSYFHKGFLKQVQNSFEDFLQIPGGVQDTISN